MVKIDMFKKYILIAFSLMHQISGNTNSVKTQKINTKNSSQKHSNVELNYILNGSIKTIDEWVSEVVKSDHYIQYIKSKLAASRARNASQVIAFLPSFETSLAINHKYSENGQPTNNKLKMKLDSKTFTVNWLKLKGTIISDIAAAKIKSKADLEEYWHDWSKFCLDEVIKVLIEWIAQKATVQLRMRVVETRKHLVKQVKARIQTGTMSMTDLHSAEGNLSTSETELFIDQNKEKVLKHKLREFAAEMPLPDKIGFIPNLGSWEENRANILSKSHKLLHLYHTKRHTVADAATKISSVLPNVQISSVSSNTKRGSDKLENTKSFQISATHHLGFENITNTIEGGKAINAAKYQYLHEVRKVISEGYEAFANLENSKKELKMHQKSLSHYESALRSKKLMFLNDIDLNNKRKIHIDDIIYAQNDVSFGCTKTIDAYKKAAQFYYTLLHLQGELANQIGNRKASNRQFKKHIQRLQTFNN